MFKIITYFYKLLSKKEKKKLYILFAVTVNSSFIEMVGIASIMPFMAVVSNPDVIQTNKWLQKTYNFLNFDTPHDFLFFLGILLFGLLICSNFFKALTVWSTLKYGNRLNYVLSRRLLAQYLSRPYSFFLNHNTSDMGKNVLAEVKGAIDGCFIAGMQALSSGLVILFVMGLLLAVEPLIAVTIAFLLGGAYTLIFLLVRHRLTRISKEQVFAQTMKYKTANEALGGIKDIKILGRELQFLDKFAVHAERHSLNTVAAGTISLFPKYVLEVLSLGGILLITMYFIGAKNNSASQMVPILAVYAFAGYRILPALQQVFSGIATVRLNLPVLELLHRDLNDEESKQTPELVLGHREDLQPTPFCSSLELKNVSFSYRTDQIPVVNEVDIIIQKNTSIGLVGATGSGKTTLVDIILGLFTPTMGHMLVDGTEIYGEALAAWQRNFGYVPQHIYLCDDTITRNIAFGVPDNKIDMPAVIRAAQIANLQGFIERKLPSGYDTIIGERGVRLSGGQRQRIGIARALYNDPAFLIMDEATNALDGVTEEAVMEALGTLSGKKTIIMIAHRLTTVKDCDLIYIMDHGRITCKGTYEELQKSSVWFQSAARNCS
jgi:ABC-type multidrug transport system fused ATPase/permease subunit